MRVLAIFLLAIALVSLLGFISISNSNNEKFSGNSQLKTFTSAVCEESGEYKFCKDELFVNCSGTILMANETKECNGFAIDNKVVGFAVFEKG